MKNLFAIFRKISSVSDEEHRYRGELRYLPHAFLSGGYAPKDRIVELRTQYEIHSGSNPNAILYVGEVQMMEISNPGQWIRRYYRTSHHDLQKVIDTCEYVMNQLNDEQFHNINISIESGAERIKKEEAKYAIK